MAEPTRADRRRRTSRVRIVAVVAVVILLAAGVGIFAATRGGDGTTTAAPPSTSSVDRVTAPNVFADLGNQTFRTASVNGKDIPVYASPDPNAAPVETLTKRTEYQIPRTLLAFNAYADWVQVYLPTRPNSSTGWVKTADVKVADQPLEWAVKVDLANYRVTVLHNGAVDFEADAAIGSPEYPTPTGTFYITDPLDLRNQPGTGYGAYALGLSGHSDVLTDFAGSDGQIALHGTDNPGDVGQAISHGCVRLKNADILRLSELPLGTPVFIS
ncbi:MAG TPA: L,D-transpeptidase [Acidimicrobiia bacterium]|nr:L,D-transpeptidase [Acidimicrobiia bacterium]